MSALKGAADSGDEEETSSDKAFRFSSSSEVDDEDKPLQKFSSSDESKPTFVSSSDVDDEDKASAQFSSSSDEPAFVSPSPPSSPSSPDAKTSTKTYQFSGPMEVASNCAYAYKTVNKNVWKRHARSGDTLAWKPKGSDATKEVTAMEFYCEMHGSRSKKAMCLLDVDPSKVVFLFYMIYSSELLLSYLLFYAASATSIVRRLTKAY